MGNLPFRLSICILTFVMGVAVTSCLRRFNPPPDAPIPVIPHGWKKVQLFRFSFNVPPDMEDGAVEHEDSEIWRSGNNNCSLVSDYGDYSSDLHLYANQPEYHAEWLRIGGESAQVETMRVGDVNAPDWVEKDRRYLAAVFFPKIGNGRAKLSMHARCVDLAAQESAKQIFFSISFK